MAKTRTPISDIGKYKLMDRLTGQFTIKNHSTLKAFDDDAAVISYGDSAQLIASTLFLEGVHFDLTYTPLKHLGYKLVVATISNILAMNALPRQLLVNLGISKRFVVEDLDDLYNGISVACEQYGVDMVGGDTSASLTGLTLSATSIGETEIDKVSYRNGAQNNHLICLTGNLGAAYMGLQLLEREKTVFEGNPNAKPRFEGYDYILQRQLKPEARKDVIDALGEEKIVPSSMIDVTKGLASEVLHLCKSSKVGARVYLDKIPIAAETSKMGEEINIDPIIAMLNGGNDYELLFTVPLELNDKIRGIGGIDIIGHIVPETKGAYMVTPDGQEIELKAQGF